MSGAGGEGTEGAAALVGHCATQDWLLGGGRQVTKGCDTGC